MRGSSLSYNADNQISTNTYDGNGNPTTYSGNTLTFDPENRMTGFNSAETNTYDGDNRRASIQTSAGTSYYVFDADEPVLTEDATGLVTKVVTIGLNRIISSHTTSSAFYTWDPQGSISQKLDATSTVQYTRDYDAFGNVAKTDSDTDNYASFGGQWGYFYDTATGLCQLGHRFYDPATGRFVTRDPIGYAGGVNTSDYAMNDPSTLFDRSGLGVVTTVRGVVIGVIVIATAPVDAGIITVGVIAFGLGAIWGATVGHSFDHDGPWWADSLSGGGTACSVAAAFQWWRQWDSGLPPTWFGWGGGGGPGDGGDGVTWPPPPRPGGYDEDE